MSLSQVQVIAPTSYSDGSTPAQMGGRSGEGISADLHGKFYTGAYRGKVFHGSTAAAGTTIPISNATAATFTLYNPIGSGINVELISYDMGITVVTSVASPILLGFSLPLTVAPTGLTALTVNPALLGSNAAAVARLYSVATIVATTTFYTMGHITATNATAGNALGSNFHYEFDGRVNLAPGTLCHVCGTAAQTSPTTQTFVWAEWPV